MYEIYSSARDDNWRFTLGKSGEHKLLVVGLNPSTATRKRPDPTVARVERVAHKHRFDGFVMLNLYPVRATNFRTLPSKVDQRAFVENLKAIDAVIAAERNPTVWAAWGESILHHDFFQQACKHLIVRLKKYRVSWLRFGAMTASGHPRHPSRISYSWSFFALDVDSYVATLPLT